MHITSIFRKNTLLWAMVLCLLTGPFISCNSGEDPVSKPNLVFILADQWRAQDLGYTGNSQVITPNIDRLAAESVNMVTAVSTTPVCAPMRASLLTGQHVLTHGLFYNDKPLMTEVQTLAEVYQSHGYETGYIGKWHINGGPEHLSMREVRDQPVPKERRRGFEYWRVYECTHNYNESSYFDEENRRHQWEGYDAFAQTDAAIDFINEKKDRPFVLFLSWGPPHAPYQTAPEKYRKMYENVEIELRANVPDSLADKAKEAIRGYYAHMTALDDAMEKLQNTLKETGQEENTIFVFTSDHGDMLHSQGMVKKQKPWDESIRVPFLIKYPDRLGKKGREIRTPIGTPDIMPTLLSLSNLPIPATVEGTDFTKVLEEETMGDTTTLIMCPVPFHQWNFLHGGREFRGLRSIRYTYARDLNGPWLLYDNLNDPFQMENLVDLPEFAIIQNQLDQMLDQKLAKINDGFLPAESYMSQWNYQWDRQDSVRPL